MDDDVLERVTRSQPRPMSDDPAVSGGLVFLVHCDGFSIVEAASVLGIRESTARGRYQRATIRLRKELAPIRAASVSDMVGQLAPKDIATDTTRQTHR